MKDHGSDFAGSGDVENGNVQQLRKLLQAVNKATSLLLTTKEDEDLEALIMESMALIGAAISFDRIHIWQYNKTDYDKTITSRYLWLSKTGAKMKTIPVNWTFSISNRPAWLETYEQGIITNSPVSELPVDDEIFFSVLDIKSIVIIPLFLENKLWGLFSADDCVYKRTLTEDELDILRSVSIMMASVITRHTMVAKRTEDLTRQTTMLATLLNTIPDQIFVKDLASRYLQCNNALYEFFDKMPADVIGKDDIDGLGLPLEIAQKFIDSDWAVFSSGLPKHFKLSVMRHDGVRIKLDTIKAPLILNGKTLGLLGISRDVTDYKQMERKIAADYEYVKKLQDDEKIG